MGSRDDVLVRIDEIEAELRGLSGELLELRALVTQTASVPAPAAAPPRRFCAPGTRAGGAAV